VFNRGIVYSAPSFDNSNNCSIVDWNTSIARILAVANGNGEQDDGSAQQRFHR
jgi:hypothetical protein